MSYTALDTVRALRDLGRDGEGGLTVVRLDGHGCFSTDEAAEKLFREFLVEDIDSYGHEELGKALVAELRASGALT